MDKKFRSLVCFALLVAGSGASAADPWKHFVLNCPSRVAIDFTTQKIIRGLMATTVWANVTDPGLGSDSRIEIEIEVSDFESKTPRPFRTLRLWYNPFDQHYTVQTEDIPVLDEGITGSNHDPMYYMTIRVTPREGAPYVLLGRTVLDLKAAL